MSENDASQTEDGEVEGTSSLDASLKLDSSSLGDEEMDFAAAMGFGSAGDDEPADDMPAPRKKRKAEVPDEPAEEEQEEEEEIATSPLPVEKAAETAPVVQEEEYGEEEEEEDQEDEDLSAPGPSNASAAQDPPDAQASVDWEEIHPRPAAEGDQDTIQVRADEVLALEDLDAPASAPASTSMQPTAADQAAFAALEASLEEARQDRLSMEVQLAERDSQIEQLQLSMEAEFDNQAGDEKDTEELRFQLDEIALERDQLIDQLAATSGHLVQSQSRSEKLEASLRAARGALTPLPEGERALRAEVIGLRGRLEEATKENLRLATEVSSVATELAIAAARVEDRQHELDYHVERAAAFESDSAEKNRQLEEVLNRQREALDLSARLQADNDELRSTQAALAETIEARDLEISAREEHLRVTRDGLATRDAQLIDANELLDRERHHVEALEADLERGKVERTRLVERVERRESRIATLTETLNRIEAAIGSGIPVPESAARVMAEATASEPVTDSSLPPATPLPTPADYQESTPPAPSEEVDPAGTEGESAAEPEPEPSSVEASSSAPAADADASPASAPVLSSEDATDEMVESALTPTLDDEGSVDDRPVEVDLESETDTPPEPPARMLSLIPPLPPILSSWRDRRLNELIDDSSATSVAGLLADRLQAQLGSPGPDAIFLRSLGGGLPDAEVRLVTALRERGTEEIHVQVLDADDRSADARRHRIELAGLGETIDVTVGDLAQWEADAPCHGILLADALHPQAHTFEILDHLAPCMASGALLLFVGRISAGPVQLSASTLMRLEELWQFLPESLATSSEGVARPPFRGDDGGSPIPEVNAGVALRARFEPIVLAGFGHLADLVVGPARGFALSEDDDEALELLESIVAIDESRTMTEQLPARHGIGIFASSSSGRTELIGQPWPEASDASI